MAGFDPVWEFRTRFEGYEDAMVMDCLTGLCEGVIRTNMIWMEATDEGQRAPCCLGQAGVTYVLPKGCGMEHPCQTVIGAREMLATGKGTCIDIACYVAAQLRLRGTPASVVFENMRDSQGLPIEGQYHALVETPLGIYDYTQDLIDGFEGQCSTDCRMPFVQEAAG